MLVPTSNRNDKNFNNKYISLLGPESRQKLLEGIHAISDMVSTTLGPQGKCVLLNDEANNIRLTKDGVTVARNFFNVDPIKNTGAQLIKNIASEVNNKSGDGTTTTTVLACKLLSLYNKTILEGHNSNELRKQLAEASSIVTEFISNYVKIANNKDIYNIALISSNNHKNISEILYKIYSELGHDAVITINNYPANKDNVSFTDGYSIDHGFSSSFFINNFKLNQCDLSGSVNILLSNSELTSMNSLIEVFEHSLKTNKPLLIITKSISDELLETIIVNKLKHQLDVCVIKLEESDLNKIDVLNDISVLTGATIVNPMSKNVISIESLGQLKEAIVTKNSCTIISGNGDKDKKEMYINDLTSSLKHTKDLSKKIKLDKRIAKLKNKIAKIDLEAANQLEFGEIYDRAEDAINAVKTAIKSGILPGGGVMLYMASLYLDEINKNLNKQGYSILSEALKTPIETMLRNANLKINETLEKINYLNKPIESKNGDFIGINFKNNEYVKMIDNGIIDPADVVLDSITKSVNLANQFSSINGLIYSNV
uniref:Uncharacterized protein LOC113788381 n=1 Tax=Dermatophagoides pteronyssinus TaxID=6956 RepID=A0A6P6XJC7_DERPT|nr:uncharacterized protein LOC113788381 [Dermatophagoides pteronyssinus]